MVRSPTFKYDYLPTFGREKEMHAYVIIITNAYTLPRSYLMIFIQLIDFMAILFLKLHNECNTFKITLKMTSWIKLHSSSNKNVYTRFNVKKLCKCSNCICGLQFPE